MKTIASHAKQHRLHSAVSFLVKARNKKGEDDIPKSKSQIRAWHKAPQGRSQSESKVRLPATTCHSTGDHEGLKAEQIHAVSDKSLGYSAIQLGKNNRNNRNSSQQYHIHSAFTY
ncbi:hypothetical protein [Bifidobacterium tissieri]|uniref:hypothetical protein n=1 Tax=Bifidobacterium tissieri TaxID=1630162 RepID=UPI001177C5BE|nr:hypothetical protein [Bifidobacterium tissieri]